ncbi:MAG: FAD-binding protein [Deltaproteobacteria bacterium]|nr:FAD-binding protein [Deltaproteobacteria bacterium]
MAVTIINFGKNLVFMAAQRLTPHSEEEVLDILRTLRSRKIRVLGSLHSWSDVVRCDDVVLDLSRLCGVTVNDGPGGPPTVTAGAGCRIHALLAALRRHSLTLPTLGAVTKQTIAGAVSTATHGSGKSSLSHYVRAIRIATYNPETRQPFILELGSDSPDKQAFRAARCSLGYLGVILSVTLECVPSYDVSETLALVESLDDVLDPADDYPLQQFIVVPYAWKYYVFRRKVDDPSRPRGDLEWLCTRTYRAYKLVFVDIILHGIVKVLAFLSCRWLTRLFYRGFPLVAFRFRGRTFTDTSEHSLTIRHDLYRHMEMEVFVPAKHIRKALRLVRHITELFAAGPGGTPLADDLRNTLRQIPGAPAESCRNEGDSSHQPYVPAQCTDSILAELYRSEGDYTHHYPIVCRRVHPDDALIAMTSGDSGDYYSVSFFTYRPGNPHFSKYCDYLARCLMHLYGARLHWGKYLPLTYDKAIVSKVYPEDHLKQFRQICARYDAGGVFQNSYAQRVLGFPAPKSSGPDPLAW